MRLRLIITLILLLGLSPLVAAQEAPTHAWRAHYWNNATLSGEPALVTQEISINKTWGAGSPDPGSIDADRFSARFERTLELPAGSYRFDLTVDDGARLWVNGRLLIDSWQPQAESTYSAEIYLPGGNIPVKLDYFENTGRATLQLDWTEVDGFASRWQAAYFDNPSLSGAPALVRDDPALAFDWGSGSPAPDRIGPDRFSARWTRSVELPAGQYRFAVTADDGVRLWVNDTLLIDAWQEQAATTYARETSITRAPTSLRVEYFEAGGQAEIDLSWRRQHAAPSLPAGSVVDNDGAGFVFGGPDTDWQIATQADSYDGLLRWTRSSADVESTYNWGRWYPTLTRGVYEVSAYIPEAYSTTSQARYWISHANGYAVRSIDQSVHSGRWVTLGTFEFAGSSSDFVSLADVTFEPETHLVAYDALRWTPVADASSAVVTVTPESGSSGTAVTVTGRGFPPGEPVYARLGWPASEPFGQYGQSTAAADGTVAFTLTLPATTPSGERLENGRQLVVLLITPDGTSGTATITLDA